MTWPDQMFAREFGLSLGFVAPVRANNLYEHLPKKQSVDFFPLFTIAKSKRCKAARLGPMLLFLFAYYAHGAYQSA